MDATHPGRSIRRNSPAEAELNENLGNTSNLANMNTRSWRNNDFRTRINRHNEKEKTGNSRCRSEYDRSDFSKSIDRLQHNQIDRNDDQRINPKSKSGYGQHIGFKYLQSLLDQPLNEVISKISENKGFYELLEKPIDGNLVVLIVHLISKFCECDFSSLRIRVLSKVLNSRFLNSIHVYVSSLALQSEDKKWRNSFFWKNPDSFWNNFSKICGTVLREMPQQFSGTLSDVLKVTLMNFPLIESEHKIHICDEIKEHLKNLIKTAETNIFEFEKKRQNALPKSNEEGEPPDDFREISLYPTTQELVSCNRPFLRKNVVKGPYRNVEHYLDVQFRLLREDFVGPLRDGIQAYLSKVETRLENVKIHKKVQFLQPITATEQYCVLLKFNSSGKPSFQYEQSRRFMFGSLACFTRDNFEHLIFGKIVDRDEKYLENGELVIGFDEDQHLFYNTDYVMVECNVFFEPYFHVLTVLKRMSEEDFPMKNYIIDVDKTVTLPSYITPNSILEIRGSLGGIKSVMPYHGIHEKFYNFNPSQNAAFIAALTREFSIIQGPPGTGKTFLGLKIARTLLNNAHAWYSDSPMLVICYTNHALDQFLEGLVSTTEKIVRIGGQSKNENLDRFNIRNYSNNMGHSTFEHKKEVRCCLSEIQTITENLNMIRQNDCILSFNILKGLVPNFQKSWLATASDEDMLKWLIASDMEHSNGNGSLIREFETLHVSENHPEPATNDDGFDAEEDDNILFREEFGDLSKSTNVKPLLNLRELYEQIHRLSAELVELRKQSEIQNFAAALKYANLKEQLHQLNSTYYYAKEKLDCGRRRMRKTLTVDIMNSRYIPRDERWNLYFHWVDLYRVHLMKRHAILNERFRLAYKIYNESKDLDNISILRNSEVIGMTTTGAARLHSTLMMMKCPIVIVEEAAEVLEAHIVSSLTKHCKQLILIGDHKQLKPSTSNYRVETFLNLGISLFERMILNDVQCFTLNVQHRMRPEISSLIKPAIYPNLEDHDSVFHRPAIKGIDKCVYFIDHQSPEETGNAGTTKINTHEVKFLIQLAKYLVLNGYEPHEITILAAYLGQMYEFKREREKYNGLLRGVRVAVLDNYQGEECDIILLSLVRNNADHKIGFLSIENRVCVALSRARNGLYVMGNMTQLCDKSKLWNEIKKTLLNQNALGPTLSLHCQKHQKITKVSTADDFTSVGEGGCDEICGIPLTCQHKCQRMCHALDIEHRELKCQEKCNRPLCDSDPLHLCQKKCGEECGTCTYPVPTVLKCNHEAVIPCYMDEEEFNCPVEVPTTLPCDHQTKKPCFVKPEEHKCPYPCDTRLECGHSCLHNCHIFDDPDHLKYKCAKPCGKPRIGCQNQELEGHMCPKLCFDECINCEIIVKKPRTVCPHFFDVECSKNVDELECFKSCKKLLPCGHKCKEFCGAPCGPCKEKFKKVVPGCNHTQDVLCSEEPRRDRCSGNCPRLLRCGHICRGKCKEVCDPLLCNEIVHVSISARCGHNIKQVPCFVNTLYEEKGVSAVEDLESYCTEPCRELLNCSPDNKHVCSGSCGVCFQGRIHKRCAEKCGQLLVCNHECDVSCRETCKPCRKKCSYKCRHSACKKRCGEPCTKCKEPCARKCEHQICKNACGDICSVPPCSEPCKKKLENCGHDCVGFCGDPCPTLCRICDTEELQEFFFGTEDEEDARFVLLNDCSHVIENSGMEQWLAQDEMEIKFKVCPKCKTTINTTERYSDYIKRAIADIMKVKEKQSGTAEENAIKRKNLLEEMIKFSNPKNSQIQSFVSYQQPYMKSILKNLGILKARLYPTKKNQRSQPINLVELDSISIKFQLIQEVFQILKNDSNKHMALDMLIAKRIQIQVKFILSNLMRELDDITRTEIEDIQRETRRLDRIVQFVLILSKANRSHSGADVADKVDHVTNLIFSLSKYKDETDASVKEDLIELNEKLKSSVGISDTERQEIVKAMGLKQGHWYKCPNGHPYCIDQCGGAMQVSRCYECKAPVGGTNHTLLPTNALASEMDGARFAAWSDTANNMRNFQF